MKYVKQFLIILIISFIGEVLYHILPFPIPASIYGITLLFFCLELNLIPLSAIKETSCFLVEIMPILFIPAAVGVIDSWEMIKNQWFAYLVITFATTLIVMVVAGHITQAIIRLGRRKKHD